MFFAILHQHGTIHGVPPIAHWVGAPHHCARDTSTNGVYPPVGGRTVQGTDANVQALNGYTCQGTPSLMDGPQVKPCTSQGGSSWHPRQPRQPLDSSTARQRSTVSTRRTMITPSTVSTVSTVLSSSSVPRQCLDSCRQLSTVVDS